MKQSVVEITGKIGNNGRPRAQAGGDQLRVQRSLRPGSAARARAHRQPEDRRLAPGEIKNFRLAFDNIPESWNRACRNWSSRRSSSIAESDVLRANSDPMIPKVNLRRETRSVSRPLEPQDRRRGKRLPRQAGETSRASSSGTIMRTKTSYSWSCEGQADDPACAMATCELGSPENS